MQGLCGRCFTRKYFEHERRKKKKKRGKGDLFKKPSVASVLLNKHHVNLKFPETVSWGEGCEIRTGTVMPQNPHQIQTKKTPPHASQNKAAFLYNCFTKVLGEQQKDGLNTNALDNQKICFPLLPTDHRADLW